MMSQEHHDSSDHQQLSCLFNCLFRHTSKKISLHYWPFVMGIHQWLVASPHKGPVIWKCFSFPGIIMLCHPTCRYHDNQSCVDGCWWHQWWLHDHYVFIPGIEIATAYHKHKHLWLLSWPGWARGKIYGQIFWRKIFNVCSNFTHCSLILINQIETKFCSWFDNTAFVSWSWFVVICSLQDQWKKNRFH